MVGPNEFWTFSAPRYQGEFQTKLRFALVRGDRDKPDEKPIYSNEFEGSINKEQFTQKQGHTPSDIMDPYDE